MELELTRDFVTKTKSGNMAIQIYLQCAIIGPPRTVLLNSACFGSHFCVCPHRGGDDTREGSSVGVLAAFRMGVTKTPIICIGHRTQSKQAILVLLWQVQ